MKPKLSPEDIAEFRKTLSPAKRIEKAADETVEPKSMAQAEAGNYPKGHVTLEGQPISIETAKGQTRLGIDEKGKEWSAIPKAHYGYIRLTRGADGDHLDVYIGPKGETGRIFVANQLRPETGEFDEHKAFIGYEKYRDAFKALQDTYPNLDRMKKSVGGMVEMSRADFEDFKKNGDLHQPIGDGLYGQLVNGTVVTRGGQFTPVVHEKVSDALGKLSFTDYGKAGRLFMPVLAKRLATLLKDVHVYTATEADMKRLASDRTMGYYQKQFNHILMVEGLSPEEYRSTLMHEAIHAATEHSLTADKGFYNLTQKLMQHVRQAMKDQQGYEDYQINKMYAFEGNDPSEFLAEAMSNKDFQTILQELDISPEMAKDLHIDQWRAASIWKALVEKIRDALGMPAKSTSALEGAMAATEYSMWARDPAEQLRLFWCS